MRRGSGRGNGRPQHLLDTGGTGREHYKAIEAERHTRGFRHATEGGEEGSVQILGGMGYINDSPTGRLLRDAKLYEIGAGTSEIRRWLIGRQLFNETR